MTSPIRFLRQVVAPNGRHRARPVLLPDEPIPPRAEPVPCQVLDEDTLHRLLNGGDAEVLECADCPVCDRITAHAMGPDSRRCWVCGTESTAGAR
ncbi:hypothetical protein ACIOK4_13740 [Streptomyces bottropensis]|uniref:hypothetical protein n=1 Tax=Streptomyces bottropensis TaxID=42235 RepID=UPI0037F8E7A7